MELQVRTVLKGFMVQNWCICETNRLFIVGNCPSLYITHQIVLCAIKPFSENQN